MSYPSLEMVALAFRDGERNSRAPMSMSTSPHPSDVPGILSPASTVALRDAFRTHLSDDSDAASARITTALGQVCSEARQEQIPAERLLVAFKGIWNSLPEVRELPPHLAAEEVRDLVTLCIERYYATD